MPKTKNHNATHAIPNNPGPRQVAGFTSDYDPVFAERNFIVSGVTLNETGAAEGGFTVYLFDMGTGFPVLKQTTVSDMSGNYSFTVDKTTTYWATTYKVGAPHKAGATLNTLVGV